MPPIDSEEPSDTSAIPAWLTRPSKTRRKKDSHDLQDLGEALVAMPDGRLVDLPMDESLLDAIRQYRVTRTHEGRRRQMQYIGKLMRDVDPEPIRERLAAWSGQSRAEIVRQHAMERWRTRLVEDDAALTEFLQLYPNLDAQVLRNHIRNARREQAAGKPPRAYRELFRIVRDAFAQNASTSR
jgi:ribosome-associated protein